MSSTIPPTTEVLVVGSGPAGLAASQWLNAAGVKVVLVDSRTRIGHPMRCGEYTRPSYFEEIGIDPEPEWIRTPAHIDIYINNGMNADGQPSRSSLYHRPWHWISVDRAHSEESMAGLLAARGVSVASACAVAAVSSWDGASRTVILRHANGTQTIRTRLIIAADGTSSVVARFADLEDPLRTSSVISYYGYLLEGLAVDNETRSDLYFYSDLSPFYFWTFPCGNGRVNVGLGVHGQRGHLARTMLDQKLALSPYAGKGRLTHQIVGWTPSDYPMAKPFADGLMICGTAARLVGPTSGEGIYYAAVSGRAAAEQYLALGGAIPTAEALSGYRRRLKPLYDQLYFEMDQRLQIERLGVLR